MEKQLLGAGKECMNIYANAYAKMQVQVKTDNASKYLVYDPRKRSPKTDNIQHTETGGKTNNSEGPKRGVSLMLWNAMRVRRKLFSFLLFQWSLSSFEVVGPLASVR